MSTIPQIKWTATLNPAVGRDAIKPGCKFCYVDVIMERIRGKHVRPPAAAKPKPSGDLQIPEADAPCGSIGDLGIGITLRSLGNTTPSERGLVAACLIEIARQINDTVPANSGNEPQH